MSRAAACSAALASALTACAGDPVSPFGGEALTPPAVYAVWWQMTEACSGRTGSFHDVKWFHASSLAGLDGQGASTLGYWSSTGNRIVLASSVVMNPRVVRHEMLHALIRGTGHPRAQFMESCGGVVTCTEECVAQAGPAQPVPSDIPRVQPDAMIVTSAVDPAEPNSSSNNAYFSLTVRVRNPASHPVVVVLPSTDASSDPVSFSYWLTGTGPLHFETESAFVRARDGSVTSFAAGETKLHVFDFFITEASDVAIGKVGKGVHDVTGSYGGYPSPKLSVRIR